MCNKRCCKNCKDLTYWDGYFCKNVDNMLSDKYIKDIEAESCDDFNQREGKQR